MGILSMAASMALGIGIGIGIGYYSCNQRSAYTTPTEKIARLEEKYKDLRQQQGIAGPQQITVDYVVDQKHQFKGFVFTDRRSGRQGVLVQQKLFGKDNHYLTYAGLEGDVPLPTERVSLFAAAGLSPSASLEHQEQFALREWWRKVRGTIDEVVE